METNLRAAPVDETLPAIAVWRTFISAHQRLTAAVDTRLTAAALPPQAWYDVLCELDSAPLGRMRMAALADSLGHTRSNLTRLVDRMERAGLLAREACPQDRRGAYCTVTNQGRTLRGRMWVVYGQAIEEVFARHLDSREAGLLAAICGRLKGAEPA